MSIKMSGGMKEDGIVVGNNFDKYSSSNLILSRLVREFDRSLSEFVAIANPGEIHEVGCGEGYWVLKWIELGINARGSDFSNQVINLARDNAKQKSISEDTFSTKSIYELTPGEDNADLIVCCEVLEHLEHPEDALRALQQVVDNYLIVSVPREPIWRVLNFMRGKYIGSLGNTPGHLQHWSTPGFNKLLSKYFIVESTKTPFPWTMLLCRHK